jgi:hypothetical protein
VSLIFVGIQIRQNTAAVKARAGYDATHSWADVNLLSWQQPDEHLLLIARLNDPESRLEDFSLADRLRFEMLMRGLIQKLEGQYHLYRSGFLDTDLWLRRSAILRGMLSTPVLKEWWKSEVGNYSTEFVEAISESNDAYDWFEPIRAVKDRAT